MQTESSDQVLGRARLHVLLAYLAALAAAGILGWAMRGQHPLLVAGLADLLATLVVFGFSVAHDNSSLYDPYWSVAPLPIAVYWMSGWGARSLLVLALVVVWGARLTGNWLARWRGLGDEDFRYREIRRKTGRLYWPASLISIHLLPTLWVFFGLVPVYAAVTGTSPWGVLDLVALLVTCAAITIEALADRQLRGFLRTRRHAEEILETGLWARCRHPNYLGEVVFWWGLYLFGLAADRSWAWSVVGPVSITLLFVLISVPWMDRRMLERHPGWAASMQRRPGLWPTFRSWRSARTGS
jgi:steroid 5-alpha reductase family enzyme